MRKIIYVLFIALFIGCDHGLDPEPKNTQPKTTGISGTIFFSNWPPADSLFDLRLVVFRTFPPVDILSEVLNGQAFVYPAVGDTVGLPILVDSVQYTMELETGNFAYIAVAQQYGPVFTTDWRAVGQYDTAPQDSLPTAVTVTKDKVLPNIDIYVDFDQLPIQPF